MLMNSLAVILNERVTSLDDSIKLTLYLRFVIDNFGLAERVF